MKNILSDKPEFIEGFVNYCFDKGFTEKQASELLRIATLKDLADSGDEHFQEGIRIGAAGSSPRDEFLKSAFLRKLLSKFIPGASHDLSVMGHSPSEILRLKPGSDFNLGGVAPDVLGKAMPSIGKLRDISMSTNPAQIPMLNIKGSPAFKPRPAAVHVGVPAGGPTGHAGGAGGGHGGGGGGGAGAAGAAPVGAAAAPAAGAVAPAGAALTPASAANALLSNNGTHYNFSIPAGVTNSFGGGAGTAALGGIGGAMYGDTENSMLQNVLTGAGIGAGARMVTGPMFRGNNFSKFVRGMNPLEAGATKGSFGVNLLRPIDTVGKALHAPGTAKAIGKGLGYGAIGGAAYNVGASGFGSGAHVDSSSFLPWYMQHRSNGMSGGGGNHGDIFSMPEGMGGGGGGYGGGNMGGGGGGPLQAINMAQSRQNEIDQRISAINSQMSSINPNDPNSHLEQQHMMREITRLQNDRNSSQKDLEFALSQAQVDRASYLNRASGAADSASHAVESLQNAYQGNLSDYQNGQKSTVSNFLNTINPLNLFNGGLENRMNRNEQRLAEQRALLQKAQQALQQLSN